MTVDPEQTPPAQRTGIWIGSAWVVAIVVLIVLAVVAVGYFTVIAVFGVPWYAAIPLSLLAGAGVILWESSFSWKAWLISAALVAVAAASALGWFVLEATG
jgi:hypothetical protein